MNPSIYCAYLTSLAPLYQIVIVLIGIAAGMKSDLGKHGSTNFSSLFKFPRWIRPSTASASIKSLLAQHLQQLDFGNAC